MAVDVDYADILVRQGMQDEVIRLPDTVMCSGCIILAHILALL